MVPNKDIEHRQSSYLHLFVLATNQLQLLSLYSSMNILLVVEEHAHGSKHYILFSNLM